MGSDALYDCYNNWIVEDTKLCWLAEQCDYNTVEDCNSPKGLGSPLGWTTNDPSKPGYNPLNQWGDGYWMLDTYMDCRKVDSYEGWFEIKAYDATGTLTSSSFTRYLNMINVS